MEMDTERQKMKNLSLSREEKEKLRREVAVDASPVWTEILYCCPEIGGEVLPKEEMEASIRLFLYNRLCQMFNISCLFCKHYYVLCDEKLLCAFHLFGNYIECSDIAWYTTILQHKMLFIQVLIVALFTCLPVLFTCYLPVLRRKVTNILNRPIHPTKFPKNIRDKYPSKVSPTDMCVSFFSSIF